MKPTPQRPADYYTAHESDALRLSKCGILVALLLLLAALLPACASLPDGPTREQQTQRMQPDNGPVESVETYRTSHGFDAPVEKQPQP